MTHLIRKQDTQRKIFLIHDTFSSIHENISDILNIFLLERENIFSKEVYLEFNNLVNLYNLSALLIQEYEFRNITIEGHMNHIMRFLPIKYQLEQQYINYYLTAKLFLHLKENKYNFNILMNQMIQLKRYIDDNIKMNIFELSNIIQLNNLFENIEI